MQLSEKNILIRLAYGASWHVPKQVSLCQLFWRLVLSLGLITLGLLLVAALVVTIWKDPKEVAITIGLSVLIVTAVALITEGPKAIKRAASRQQIPKIVVTAYKGVKQRFCPIITIQKD